MIGQQGQAEGKPQEAGGACGSAVGTLASGAIESACPF